MATVDEEIIHRIQKLNQEQKQNVLEYVRTLESPKRSARELMKLPVAERQRLVEASIKLAENEEFETFEAHSEEHFDESN